MVRSKMARGGWVLLGVLAWFACSDDSTDGGHDGMHDTSSHVMCGDQANCTDTVDLADGLEGESSAGTFMAEITSQNGLRLDENEWMVMVTDADGNPVEDATVSVQTFSVDCGHEGPCPPADAVEHMPGMYMVTPVHAHGGPWNTVLSIEKDGANDEVTWRFCVDAPGHGEGALPPVTCPDGSEGDVSHAGHNQDAGDGDDDAGHTM